MPEPRYRVAIVGAGPSGLFAAQFLTARDDIEVDIFDRLPTPYGLLRYGVAPDHTSIKAVAHALARVFGSASHACAAVLSDLSPQMDELFLSALRELAAPRSAVNSNR